MTAVAATFIFDSYRGGDHPRSYGYREPRLQQRGRTAREV